MNINTIDRKTAVLIGGLTAFFAGLSLAAAQSPSRLEVGRFSVEKALNLLPAHWEPFYFKNIKRHTDYRLVEEDGQVAVRATAAASASGLTRKITIDPKEYPIIQWRWKVKNILKRADIRRKEGDDYPARIYIVFEYVSGRLGFSEKVKYGLARMLYGEYPPLATLNYVWASNAPVGLVAPNPYTERAMMIVVESGEKSLNAWISEERNLYEDYRKAFEDEPPMISGVAIMTDTDNTGESATAFYGDILFRKDSH
ncbi:MAG: DUF3047 domain-containing protein [Deltaproteobacteria bacterium]|nr:DUF3047 domain-containing protein [Deltaproteobacteria bacterium]